MSFNRFTKWSSHTVFVTAVLFSPLAYAAPPVSSAPDNNEINSLQLAALQLPYQALGQIRGGFDVKPGLSISFAFQQVDYQGKTVIQSILVPLTTLTSGSGGAIASVTGGGTTTLTQQGAGDPTVINVGGNTIQVPAGTSSITLSSSINQGASVVISSLGGGGISNIISNTANNMMLSQVTTMNVEITGMSQWLAQQGSGLGAVGGAFGNLGFSR
ncbi:hypothetical protein GCM10010909_24400 [Acidocella aquatica]|uniref:Uncharacterized protein n=1 Tax=Acidocella aquatica TaxID=1922313 RepID=A0ABQ6A6F1_9PROT|nr:hypothetical protein [Acidocella aquatica]GLR67759.1 hypothetical protein GCM10010909_24400 [Acidocella aquatica]